MLPVPSERFKEKGIVFRGDPGWLLCSEVIQCGYCVQKWFSVVIVFRSDSAWLLCSEVIQCGYCVQSRFSVVTVFRGDSVQLVASNTIMPVVREEKRRHSQRSRKSGRSHRSSKSRDRASSRSASRTNRPLFFRVRWQIWNKFWFLNFQFV